MWNNALRLLDTVSDGSVSGRIPAENTDLMWSTLITGLIVVFLILVILVAILWGMGKLLNIKIKRKPKAAKNAAASAPAPASAAAAPAPVQAAEEEYYDEDDSEIIAVIAAAIAAYGESEGKQYRIASVRKRDRSQRSNWSAAGISENTRPF
ncbi:MAG: OadG family protein [Oscillospiraceae bacterium]|nr:OadG family protein [Oscillospiraceae bacterium]